ncbi:hypothetical protein CR513_40136, partial [Mucuna pruriens]
MNDPRVSHMVAAKHILSYLKGRQSFDLEGGTVHKKLNLTLIQVGLETKWTKRFGHESNCTWKKQSYRNKKFHILRDQVSKEKLKLVYCSIELHVANVFTKSLKLDPFKKLGESLEF